MLNEWNADIWHDKLCDTSLLARLLQLSVISSYTPVRSPSSPILPLPPETIAGALQRTCRGYPEGGLLFEGSRDSLGRCRARSPTLTVGLSCMCTIKPGWQANKYRRPHVLLPHRVGLASSPDATGPTALRATIRKSTPLAPRRIGRLFGLLVIPINITEL